MYSMVMMMAMTASPESVACHRSNGCLGGGSCHGAVAYSGCHGSRFGSCHGGGLFSGGGCNGSYASGCHGGHQRHHSVGSGCYGGSCHGGGLFNGGGCNGGLFRRHGHGCNGGYSTGGCHGGGYSTGCTGGGYGVPSGTIVPEQPKKAMPMKTSAPANITVNVPADAKISIDGAPTTSTSTVRLFSTPELATGTVYYYTISAEVVREGKTLVATEKVAVEAGTNVQISLTPQGQSFVSK